MTHLQFFVDFHTVSVQHGQVERTKISIETGERGERKKRVKERNEQSRKRRVSKREWEEGVIKG